LRNLLRNLLKNLSKKKSQKLSHPWLKRSQIFQIKASMKRSEVRILHSFSHY
jgi:hypothetical protein